MSHFSSDHSSTLSKPQIRGNVVMRQELQSFTPDCNTKCAIIVLIILTILFLSFGIPILIIGSTIQYIKIDYTNCTIPKCILSFTLPEPIKPPSYIYYQINNFYSSHRYLLKSKVPAQLRGEVHVDSSNNKDCKGAQFMKEMFDNDTSKYVSWKNKPLKGEDYANPCGLIAKCMFNDTGFSLTYEDGTTFPINETNITNEYDRKYVYGTINNSSDVQWIDVTNEHFIVWMQMETFESFKKLWGRIEEELPKGRYELSLENNWNATSFNGGKEIIISGSSKIGTGMFFGYVLCGAAIYCVIMIMILWLCQMKTKKRVYTTNDLKWD